MSDSTSRPWIIWQSQLQVLWIALLLPCAGWAQNAAVTSIGSSTKSQESIATTWLVIRHAERESEADLLSAAGLERAQVIKELGEILRVDAIYSTDTLRTRSTVEDLAKSRGIEIENYGKPSKVWLDDVRKLHAGKVILIVGHSNTVGVIAGLLANKAPFEMAPDEYDSLFIITSTESPLVESNQKTNETLTLPQTSIVRMKYGRSSVGAPAVGPEKMAPLTK